MRRVRWASAVVTALLTVTSTVLAGASPALAATTITGPDVASYQHPHGACIDWATVAAGQASTNTPPRQFAFIKATEGTFYTNPYFGSCGGDAALGDWSAAAAAGVVRGAYHFARPALPMSTATDQAKYFAAAIGTQTTARTLPPVLDLETSGGLTPGQLVTWTQTWLDAVRKATGRVPMVYSYPYFWASAMASSAAFHRYPLWIADYNGAAAPSSPLSGGWPAWTAWQYSSSVSQPGIDSSRVDMSQFNGDAAALASLGDGTASSPWTVTPPAAPVNVAAAPGDGSATVSWVPGDNGGALVSSYLVTASTGQTLAVGGTSTAATLRGLTNGAKYTFTVTATSSAGGSAASASSGVVVPAIPTDITSWLSATSIIYGQATTMNATLVRTDTGAPLPGQQLEVWQRPAGGTSWTHVATAPTDGSGTGRWSFVPQASTDTRMTWTPPAGYEPQTTFVRTVTVNPIPTVLTTSLRYVSAPAGAWNAVSATLRRADTQAVLAGQPVAVFRRLHGTAIWVKAADLTTSRAGTLRWWFRPTANTDVELVWAGPAHYRSAASARTAHVRPLVSAAATATVIRVGHSVWLHGSVSPSLAGRTVYRQGYYNGTWHTWAAQTLSSRSTYSFTITPSMRTTNSYRVYLPGASTYDAAVSRTVGLRVR